MDRRGHALPGMDRIYMHAHQMREDLSGVLEQLWHDALTERHEIHAHSRVTLLDHLLHDVP